MYTRLEVTIQEISLSPKTAREIVKFRQIPAIVPQVLWTANGRFSRSFVQGMEALLEPLSRFLSFTSHRAQNSRELITPLIVNVIRTTDQGRTFEAYRGIPYPRSYQPYLNANFPLIPYDQAGVYLGPIDQGAFDRYQAANEIDRAQIKAQFLGAVTVRTEQYLQPTRDYTLGLNTRDWLSDDQRDQFDRTYFNQLMITSAISPLNINNIVFPDQDQLIMVGRQYMQRTGKQYMVMIRTVTIRGDVPANRSVWGAIFFDDLEFLNGMINIVLMTGLKVEDFIGSVCYQVNKMTKIVY